MFCFFVWLVNFYCIVNIANGFSYVPLRSVKFCSSRSPNGLSCGVQQVKSLSSLAPSCFVASPLEVSHAHSWFNSYKSVLFRKSLYAKLWAHSHCSFFLSGILLIF